MTGCNDPSRVFNICFVKRVSGHETLSQKCWNEVWRGGKKSWRVVTIRHRSSTPVLPKLKTARHKSWDTYNQKCWNDVSRGGKKSWRVKTKEKIWRHCNWTSVSYSPVSEVLPRQKQAPYMDGAVGKSLISLIPWIYFVCTGAFIWRQLEIKVIRFIDGKT